MLGFSNSYVYGSIQPISASIVKPVAHFDVYLPWIGKMGAAERQAVVQKEPAIRQVQRGDGDRGSFTQVSAE